MSVISILHLASNFYVSDIIDIAHLTMNTHHTMDTHDIRDTHHMMDTHYTMDAHYDDEHPSYDGQPSLECHLFGEKKCMMDRHHISLLISHQ